MDGPSVTEASTAGTAACTQLLPLARLRAPHRPRYPKASVTSQEPGR
jgi:hypothetical protein